MSIKDKIEYARLRSVGAAVFGQDEQEANKWIKAIEELEADGEYGKAR